MINLALVAYVVCSVAYLFLSIVLLIGWKGKKEGGLLLLASLLTLAWGVTGFFVTVTGGKLILVSLIVEVIRNIAILGFLLALLKKVTCKRVDDHFKVSSYFYTVLLISAAISLYALGIDLTTVFTGTLNTISPSMAGHLAMSVLTLALLEQLYRNTDSEKRWGIRYICFAFAGIFVYEFYLYADALLFKRIDAELWSARPWIVAVVSPLIAVSAARNPKWSLDVYVSRQAVFHTASLVCAGVYLLLMSIAGFYIKEYGGDWGKVAQAVFIFAAIMFMLLIMLSGKIRAWLKVTLSKHFFNYKYDYREEWIKFNATLTALDDILPIRSRAIKSIAQIVESPAGILFTKNQSNDYEAAASWNTPAPETSVIKKEVQLTLFSEETGWIIDLYDLKQDKGKCEEFKLDKELFKDEYRFIVPLLNDDELYGFIVLNQPRSKLVLNWEDTDVLKTAGNQVASYLAQYDANNQLTIARQFEAYNRLSTFVIHDLKNLVGQLSLLSSNSKKYRHNEEFIDDAFETVENSVDKMKHLLEQLRSGIDKEVVGILDLNGVLEKMLQSRKAAGGNVKFSKPETPLLVSADKDELATVIEHILQNAIDATAYLGKDADVSIGVNELSNFAVVTIEDNGEGMSREFIRDRLFSPFDTTKGDSGMGVGVYQAREYISKIGGRIEVSSEVGEGTVFKLHLPLTVSEE